MMMCKYFPIHSMRISSLNRHHMEQPNIKRFRTGNSQDSNKHTCIKANYWVTERIFAAFIANQYFDIEEYEDAVAIILFGKHSNTHAEALACLGCAVHAFLLNNPFRFANRYCYKWIKYSVPTSKREWMNEYKSTRLLPSHYTDVIPIQIY